MLFINEGGMVVCEAHGGMYLKAELTRRPTAKKINTPLDRWTVIRSKDQVHPDDLLYMTCESCGKGL